MKSVRIADKNLFILLAAVAGPDALSLLLLLMFFRFGCRKCNAKCLPPLQLFIMRMAMASAGPAEVCQEACGMLHGSGGTAAAAVGGYLCECVCVCVWQVWVTLCLCVCMPLNPQAKRPHSQCQRESCDALSLLLLLREFEFHAREGGCTVAVFIVVFILRISVFR